MIERDEGIEQIIPRKWRSVIRCIVEDVCQRQLRSRIVEGGEITVAPNVAQSVYRFVDAYGERLCSLPEASWNSSRCRWMGTYWHLLIDLYTEGEGLSDLVLFVDVFEQQGVDRFVLKSVHVP